MVISNNIAGLCNRIKSLLSAMRIAEFNKDSEVKIYWPFTAAVGECHFTDLFENEKVIILGKKNWHPGIIGIVAIKILIKKFLFLIKLNRALLK